MTNGNEEEQVYRFIFEKIDSVPHLEALMLLWNSRPAQWSEQEVAKRLYIDPNSARKLLADLVREDIISLVPGSIEKYCYRSKSDENDRLLELIDVTYRQQMVRVSTMIHSKASSPIRDFARAFRFTKERE